MPNFLWMHGAVASFAPPPLHTTGYSLRGDTFRKLESCMGKSGYPCTKLKNKQNVLWRHNLSSIISFLQYICLRWNKSARCSVQLHCFFLILSCSTQPIVLKWNILKIFKTFQGRWKIFKDNKMFSRIKDITSFDNKFKDSSWRSKTTGNLNLSSPGDALDGMTPSFRSFSTASRMKTWSS